MTPDQPFEAPWHASAFAVTVALAERGAFTWSEWTQALGEELSKASIHSGDAYYHAWITALEKICMSKKLTELKDLQTTKARWEEAYLSTPHGQPVQVS